MLNRRGISRAVVLLALIAIVLVIAIAVPIVQSKREQMNKSLDDLYESSAKDEAYLIWVQDNRPFSALYDSENKKFVNLQTSMSTVTPYGMSKNHVGMILFVSVDEEGNISTKWVYQETGTAYK